MHHRGLIGLAITVLVIGGASSCCNEYHTRRCAASKATLGVVNSLLSVDDHVVQPAPLRGLFHRVILR